MYKRKLFIMTNEVKIFISAPSMMFDIDIKILICINIC